MSDSHSMDLRQLQAKDLPVTRDEELASDKVPETTPADLQREVCSLYETYGGALLRYATAIAGNREMAHDAVQESFLRYFARRSDGTVIEAPRAWLYKVVFNYVLDNSGESNLPLEYASKTADPDHGPLADVEAAQLSDRFADILSPRELSCVRLRAEGLSYDEIACVLGIRIGTVGALLARAVRKIKRELNKD
ncbi:MAG TPA: sigma-70 family RNA polymerase sigma factor [Bryobacteraceae bacterium]|nr:sigma-70 family RNA polymerase sigma factor [Bryobacteraceae bacterium]